MGTKATAGSQNEPSPTNDPDIVTTEELAALLNLTKLTIQKLRDNGVISHMYTGLENESGAAVRYSYSQVKQELIRNAERHRVKRMTNKNKQAEVRVAQVVDLLDNAVLAGLHVTPESIARQLEIGIKLAKSCIAEAAKVVIERRDLVSRAAIAQEYVLDPRRVHALMHQPGAPEPVFQVGRTFYYRRADIDGIIRDNREATE